MIGYPVSPHIKTIDVAFLQVIKPNKMFDFLDLKKNSEEDIVGIERGFWIFEEIPFP